MYGDLAWLWPIVSPPEDYVEQSELLAKIIKERSKIGPGTLLHLGCGGGHNDHTFKEHFEVTGVDISDEMLKLARDLNPEVKYRRGDMRSVRLEEVFDSVVILDSIDYMCTEADLRSAFVTAYEHLKPGGIFATFVEDRPGTFKQNRTKSSFRSNGNIELVFIENSYDPDPGDTSYEASFVYLLRRAGELEIHTDKHTMGIFKLETWLRLLKEVGFSVEQMNDEDSTSREGEDQPILVCSKPL
jgi:SAM-dependent methyltransferase